MWLYITINIITLIPQGAFFVKGARKGVHRNYFHETTLAELLHAMEFLLIFDETNFIEVPKIL